MWLKIAVNSIFWSFMILIFYYALDVLTNVDFALKLYSPGGFLILYIATFVYLTNLYYKPK